MVKNAKKKKSAAVPSGKPTIAKAKARQAQPMMGGAGPQVSVAAVDEPEH